MERYLTIHHLKIVVVQIYQYKYDLQYAPNAILNISQT